MISNNSLSAFSAGTTIAPRQAPVQPHPVRDQVAPSISSGAASKNGLLEPATGHLATPRNAPEPLGLITRRSLHWRSPAARAMFALHE